MIRNKIFVRHSVAAIATAVSIVLAAPAFAEDMAPAIPTPSEADVLKDIQQTFGGVPTFIKALPKSALAAFWLLERDLEANPKTALDMKTKALIGLAVSAQIPCQYCIWADTEEARAAGATDQELSEAVAMAGLTRAYSTIFNGMQVDFAQFKKDLTPPAN
jgi:AhpD family alkylhydroperoxidase